MWEINKTVTENGGKNRDGHFSILSVSKYIDGALMSNETSSESLFYMRLF